MFFVVYFFQFFLSVCFFLLFLIFFAFPFLYFWVCLFLGVYFYIIFVWGFPYEFVCCVVSFSILPTFSKPLLYSFIFFYILYSILCEWSAYRFIHLLLKHPLEFSSLFNFKILLLTETAISLLLKSFFLYIVYILW